jgi:hypothetical protein
VDSTNSWDSISALVDSLLQGDVPVSFASSQPTPSAVHGAKLALRLLRSEGASLEPLPAILAMPWGSIVIWWRTSPQRRIEVISRDEAYEFRDTGSGTKFRRFMSGPAPEDE